MKIFPFQISGGVDLRILGVDIKPLIRPGGSRQVIRNREMGGGIVEMVFRGLLRPSRFWWRSGLDYFHLSGAFRASQGVNLIYLLDTSGIGDTQNVWIRLTSGPDPGVCLNLNWCPATTKYGV